MDYVHLFLFHFLLVAFYEGKIFHSSLRVKTQRYRCAPMGLFTVDYSLLTTHFSPFALHFIPAFHPSSSVRLTQLTEEDFKKAN